MSTDRTQQSKQKAASADPARPLHGWRVVITRSEDRADGLADQLRALGAEPIVYPTIMFAPPADWGVVDAALQRLLAGAYDWLVLTSVTAVQAVHERLTILTGLAPTMTRPRLRIATVGPATAAACTELLGISPALVPEKFVAEALAEALTAPDRAPHQGLREQRILLANADLARPKLEEMLRAGGALVERVVVYHTVPARGGVDLPALLAQGQVDVITFTSGSTVRYFVDRIGPTALSAVHQVLIACIGPITAEAVRAVGLTPTIVARNFTEAGLLEALVEYVSTLER